MVSRFSSSSSSFFFDQLLEMRGTVVRLYLLSSVKYVSPTVQYCDVQYEYCSSLPVAFSPKGERMSGWLNSFT